jgi:hypothetical protein
VQTELRQFAHASALCRRSANFYRHR